MSNMKLHILFVISCVNFSLAFVELNQSLDDLLDEQSKNHSLAFHVWWNELLANYDQRIRPYFNVKPIQITVGLTILSVSSMSESTMQWTVEMYFHEYWLDPRLHFNATEFGSKNAITLPHDAHFKIWTPDTSFINAISSKVPKLGSVSHLSFMRVNEGGHLFWDRRISVTATCHMDLTMYPFDNQACTLELSSFGHNVDGIVYQWISFPIPGDIQNINLPDFYAIDSNSRAIVKKYVAGNYSVLQLCVIFKRRAGFCFLQLFIPATAVVGASWISLWLENETEFADIVAIILSIIFLSFSYNSVMPKVSYIKAMDIYLGACFIFAFFSLAKLAIVKYMRKRCKKRLQYLGHRTTDEKMQLVVRQCGKNRHDNVVVSGDETIITDSMVKNLDHDTYWKVMKVFHIGSQLVLPLAFMLFAVFFFFIYPRIATKFGKCFEK